MGYFFYGAVLGFLFSSLLYLLLALTASGRRRRAEAQEPGNDVRTTVLTCPHKEVTP